MTVAASYCLLSSSREILSKTFDVDANGEIIKGGGGHISQGNIKRVDRTADDVPAWMRAFAPDIEKLGYQEALMPGVPINGLAFQGLATKLHPRAGAISRTQNNFSFTTPALACLDGDRPGSTDLYADALAIDPSLAEVCITRRLSVSGSVIKPDGTPFSESEHLFMLVSRPDRMREYADLMVEMSFLRGKGWFKISGRGGALIRGVFDQYVFTREHVLYEGDGALKGGLVARPRPLTFANAGTKIFDVDAAITRAKTLLADPANALIVANAKAKALSGLAIEIATKRQAWFEKNKARLLALGISLKRIENEFRIKRAVFRSDRIDEHEGVSYPRWLLTSLDDLQMDDGSTLGVGVFLTLTPSEQRAYEYRHCADPYEPDYNGGSRTTATFLWSEYKNRMMIFSHAHGGAIYWMQQTEHFDGDESFNPDLPPEYFDYVSLLVDKDYIHVPTKANYLVARKLDNHLPRAPGLTPTNQPTTVGATKKIDQYYFVHGRTWWPGEPEFLVGYAASGDAIVPHAGSTLINTFVPPPAFAGGIAANAHPWVGLCYDIFGTLQGDALLDFLAFIAQHIGIKINYAAVLAGAEGIGKNTLLQPMLRFLGDHNVNPDVSVQEVDSDTGFNRHFRQKLFIVINEATKASEDRRVFTSNKLKTLLAQPPEFLIINEKKIAQYLVPNVVNVAITTNFALDGVHIESKDARRYLMLGSDAVPDDLGGSAAISQIAIWIAKGGWRDCIQFLLERDVSRFNPGASPLKTELFYRAAEASRSVLEVEVEDAVDAWLLNRLPEQTLFSIEDIIDGKGPDAYIRQPKFRSAINSILDKLGWTPVRNPNVKRGKWVIPGVKGLGEYEKKVSPRVLYGKKGCPNDELIRDAETMIEWMKIRKK